MAKILITSGPTRQYLDPVRYLTNASSGRMGRELTRAVLELGHEAIVISGPVEVDYPAGADVTHVISTEEMLAQSQEKFLQCDGLIGAAAPCDYRPMKVEPGKIAKTGEPLQLHLVETPDVVATLGASKSPRQWTVGFALETEDARFRATTKLHRKRCDLIVLNGPAAMNAEDNTVDIIAPEGNVLTTISGGKDIVADGILAIIQQRLIEPTSS